MSRKALQRTVLSIIVVVAIFGGVRVLLAALTPTTERWTTVSRRDLVLAVEMEGELKSVESAQLGPPALSEVWNFKISFLAPEGSDIEAGQPVLGFDASQLEQQLARLVAERDAAEKELEKKETDVLVERRAIELQTAEAEARMRRAELKLDVPAEVASRTELAQARIDQRLAALELESLARRRTHLESRTGAEVRALRQTRDRRAEQVRDIETNIERMMVRAPRAGTVVYVSRRGEKPTVGEAVWRARYVVEIPDLARMAADATIAEADAGQVAVGQPVTFSLDAFPDELYHGTVASVRRAVQQKSWRDPQKIVKVEIALGETDTQVMRPGMRFRGRIEVDRRQDVLTVPADAVFTEPGGVAVYVRSFFGKQAVRPQLGARDDEAFEVESGLEEGQWVLLRGAHDEGSS